MWSICSSKYIGYSITVTKNCQQILSKIYLNEINVQKNFMSSTNKREKIYRERKLIGFSMDQIYSVVADVGNYNKFVPFCKKSKILKENPEFIRVDLEIGFPPIVEKYISNVSLVKPRMVKAECFDGRLFDHLMTIWRFSPALKNNLHTCIIDFYICFEFKSVLHSHLAHLFFDVLVRQMEEAFIKECKVRYGNASVPSKRLKILHSTS